MIQARRVICILPRILRFVPVAGDETVLLYNIEEAIVRSSRPVRMIVNSTFTALTRLNIYGFFRWWR